MSNSNLILTIKGVLFKTINGVIIVERDGINLIVIDKRGLMLEPSTPLWVIKELIELLTDDAKIKRLKKAVKDFIDDGSIVKMTLERDY